MLMSSGGSSHHRFLEKPVDLSEGLEAEGLTKKVVEE